MRGGTPAESALLCLRYRRDAAFWTDGTIAAPSCFVAGAIAALFHFVVGTIVARPVSLPVQSSRVLFRFRCNRRAVFIADAIASPPCFCFRYRCGAVLFCSRPRCGAALLHGRCNRRADPLYGKRRIRRLWYSVLSPKVSFTASCRCASAGAPRHICVAAARCCCGCRPVLP